MATVIPTTSYNDETTSSSSDDGYHVNIFYAIFIPCLSALTIMGNLLIMVSFWKVPSLHEKPSELLILNLSCLDMLTGLQFLYYSPVFIIGHWPFGEFGCRMANAIFYLSIHGSLFTLVAISVDRVLLVWLEYPKYMKMMSSFRIRLTILACWIAALCTVILEHSIWDVAKKVDESAAVINFNYSCLTPPRRLKLYSRTAFVVFYLLPVSLVCGLSIAFIYLLHGRLQKTKRVGDNAGSSSGQATQSTLAEASTGQPGAQSQMATTGTQTKDKSSQHKNRYIKPAVSLLAVVSAMAVCMLPYCFYVITIESCYTCYNAEVFYILIVFKYCNAFLDPFLYGLTQRKIRMFCLSILGKKAYH